MISLDALERLAAEATPGPWAGLAVAPADIPFIAACDPVTVAALVRAVRAAQAFDATRGDFGFTIRSGPASDDLRAALAPFRTEEVA